MLGIVVQGWYSNAEVTRDQKPATKIDSSAASKISTVGSDTISRSHRAQASGLFTLSLDLGNRTVITGRRGKGFDEAFTQHLLNNHNITVAGAWKIYSQGRTSLTQGSQAVKFMEMVKAAKGDPIELTNAIMLDRLAANPTIDEFNRMQTVAVSQPWIDLDKQLMQLAQSDKSLQPLAEKIGRDQKARELYGLRGAYKSGGLVEELRTMRDIQPPSDRAEEIADHIVEIKMYILYTGHFDLRHEVSRGGVTQALKMAGYSKTEINDIMRLYGDEFDEHWESVSRVMNRPQDSGYQKYWDKS